MNIRGFINLSLLEGLTKAILLTGSKLSGSQQRLSPRVVEEASPFFADRGSSVSGYPASWNQHSSGQQPRPYDKLGNYSFINLDGREKEFDPRAGLISLAHFPSRTIDAVAAKYGDDANKFCVESKFAIAGIGKKNDTPELAFLDYLQTIRRPVRSFIHYNNWYDGTGKNLKPENFVDKIAHEFMVQMKPYGVKVDAFVPDNGWQNRSSIWQPNPRQFPEGMKSFTDLGAALKKEGTSLGLWFALNGYELNTDWGLKNGYFEAQRNPHFSRFNRYYALGDPHYNADLRKQLSALIKEGQLNYIKHDFNDMCDSGPHNGTLPTDRHGHEKAVDETLSILKMERDLNPEIFQNVTNWAWFSPWWLQHCNTIWMLSDDTGANRKWPAISDWQMATTYRDAHLFKAWGDPATRPLVPISHLMTHGIVNATGAADGSMSDSLQEWSDYVTMYYARGVQLKEWYITPSKMDEAHWKILGERSKWAQENSATLANAVYIGGTPEKGEAYGYVAWNGDKGIVTVRNPDIKEQTITVPFDKTVWYRGENGRDFLGHLTYPLGDSYYPKDLFKSGEAFTLKIPGWTTMTLELRLGTGPMRIDEEPIPAATFKVEKTNEVVSIDVQTASKFPPPDLVLFNRGGDFPTVKRNDVEIIPTRVNHGPGWKVALYALKPDSRFNLKFSQSGIFGSSGNVTSAWLNLHWSPLFDMGHGESFLNRQTLEILPPTEFKSASNTRPVPPAQLQSITAAKLYMDLFGSDAGQFANKKLLLNGDPILTLPANKHGDNWEEFTLDLPAEALKKIALENKLRITNPSGDKFKFRNLTLAVKLPDGTWSATPPNTQIHCHDNDWAHFEGTPFQPNGESAEIILRFEEKK